MDQVPIELSLIFMRFVLLFLYMGFMVCCKMIDTCEDADLFKILDLCSDVFAHLFVMEKKYNLS